MNWCEWCEADSGRMNAKRACCIARGLAKQPFLRRVEAIAAVRASEGEDAARELVDLVLNWMATRLWNLPKTERVAAYDAAAKNGWLRAELEQRYA